IPRAGFRHGVRIRLRAGRSHRSAENQVTYGSRVASLALLGERVDVRILHRVRTHPAVGRAGDQDAGVDVNVVRQLFGDRRDGVELAVLRACDDADAAEITGPRVVLVPLDHHPVEVDGE